MIPSGMNPSEPLYALDWASSLIPPPTPTEQPPSFQHLYLVIEESFNQELGAIVHIRALVHISLEVYFEHEQKFKILKTSWSLLTTGFYICQT